MHSFWKFLLICLCTTSLMFLPCRCKKQSTAPEQANPYPFGPPSSIQLDAHVENQRLARCVNIGNALEAPEEGDWGVTLEANYFQLIKDGGFSGIRLPIRWSTHAQAAPPYAIDKFFFSRIDWAVAEALSRGLNIVINIHHYEEIMQAPAEHKERFLALWRQIAEHYKNYPDGLFFELLNEPMGNLSAEIWNTYLAEALAVIRQSNPYRMIVVGPVNWNSYTALSTLRLPQADRSLIVTFHYYNPFQFTHQGAEWVDGSAAWMGTLWPSSAASAQTLANELEQAASWGVNHDRPLFMGEFGAYAKADMNSRKLWTESAARQAENRHISWAYWEFCAGFGVYDAAKKAWNFPLLKALIP